MAKKKLKCNNDKYRIVIAMSAVVYIVTYAIRYSFAINLLRMAFEMKKEIFWPPRPYEFPGPGFRGNVDDDYVILFQNPYRALLMAAYFLGMVIGVLPATRLVQGYGTRFPVGLALCFAGVAHFFIYLPKIFPVAFKFEVPLAITLFVVRFVTGLCFSFVLPGLQKLLRMWVNDNKRLIVQKIMALSTYVSRWATGHVCRYLE